MCLDITSKVRPGNLPRSEMCTKNFIKLQLRLSPRSVSTEELQFVCLPEILGKTNKIKYLWLLTLETFKRLRLFLRVGFPQIKKKLLTISGGRVIQVHYYSSYPSFISVWHSSLQLLVFLELNLSGSFVYV